jgi:hypothetical protein
MVLIKFKYSDISLSGNRNNVIEKVTKAKAYYPYVVLLIEDDRETAMNRARTRYFDGMLASLTQTVLVLFSKHKCEYFILFC